MTDHAKMPQTVEVVMDAEWLDDGSVRVHCLGVFTPGNPKPAGSNVVTTWLNIERPRSHVGVFNIDTREDQERWWIATERLDQPHEKVLGPFESRDLALVVRRYVEQVEHRSYWVDREGISFYAEETP